MWVPGLRGGVILVLFVGLMSRLPVVKVVDVLPGWRNALIFPLYYLSLKKFTWSEKLATRCAKFHFFLPHDFIEIPRVKLMILTQKIIFHPGVCHSHQSSCQFHHSSYIKVSKISPTPRTRNSYARPSVGQPLVLGWVSVPWVSLRSLRLIQPTRGPLPPPQKKINAVSAFGQNLTWHVPQS